ncbi:FadR family transcriptional regulator [Leucobacter sp. CSA1]|uniref:FadR family transcriptional regulator n=1 Tax=Leucobacter chromiisoli TaxID=2796471 RepID=A0A934Q7W8_9MICO|nr:FCD domain-containing protein [Leucobacter chromiisoli]MBK0419879.1 FadR family transcriptional regulator [Leucobacter chromiisoli]
MAETLHDQLLQALGTRIVSGELPEGSVLLADNVAGEHGVSRPVVREAVRVLQSLGLVAATKRVGIRVLPPTQWNLYDPLVIRWRIAVGSTGGQLRSLTELRSAVEPKAAEMAAEHREDRMAVRILDLAAEMRTVGRSGDLHRFLELDIAFHSLVLEASGNEMFVQLDSLVAEVLTARTEQGLMPERPHEDALALHLAVAEAIWERDAGAAHSAMDRIMRRTVAEVSKTWSHVPRPSVLATDGGDGAAGEGVAGEGVAGGTLGA